MSQKIVLFKLINGEELIGKVVEEDDNTYTLAKPRVMMVQPAGNGQMQVGMIPWLVGTPDGDCKVYKDKIAGEPAGDLPKQLEDGYLQQTSNIQLAGNAAGLDLSKK